MGGKGGKKKETGADQLTLREKSIGKKQGHVNAKTMCKIDHLKNLAVWAASESSIPSFGAFFGERLAATTVALGLRADPCLFICERCESILQPGHNCTVRIEKNNLKRRPRCKKSNLTQNNIVYRCHSCSHLNVMRGAPKGYLKETCPPKAKIWSKLQPAKSTLEKNAISANPLTIISIGNKVDVVALPTVNELNPETSSPATPLPATCLSLLDSKRKKRNRSSGKKVVEPDIDVDKSIHPSSQRRKKSWASLKEIAQSGEHDIAQKKLTNLTIPFFI